MTPPSPSTVPTSYRQEDYGYTVGTTAFCMQVCVQLTHSALTQLLETSNFQLTILLHKMKFVQKDQHNTFQCIYLSSWETRYHQLLNRFTWLSLILAQLFPIHFGWLCSQKSVLYGHCTHWLYPGTVPTDSILALCPQVTQALAPPPQKKNSKENWTILHPLDNFTIKSKILSLQFSITITQGQNQKSTFC